MVDTLTDQFKRGDVVEILRQVGAVVRQSRIGIIINQELGYSDLWSVLIGTEKYVLFDDEMKHAGGQ